MDQKSKDPRYYRNQTSYSAKLNFLKEIYLTRMHILKILFPGEEIS